MKRISTAATAAALTGLIVMLLGSAATAQQSRAGSLRDAAVHPPGITSISVCSPAGSGGAGSSPAGTCPAGSQDTHQLVLGPDGSSINKFVNGGISDEHSSVFSPGTLQNSGDYLFFVATRSSLNSDTGLLVLSGGSGPNQNGQWTFDFPNADGYGSYPAGFGQIFLSAVGRGCPSVADGNPVHQDQTFDLNYAAPGSVVKDPTAPPGSLLMIYEGTNTCFGTTGGPRSNNFFSTVGIATSSDYGRNWPTYRGKSGFTFVPLPEQNTSQGPESPMGALGEAACAGIDCTTSPASSYGRYPVLSPSLSIATAMATGKPLPSSMGDAELSGFVDDAATGPAQFIYVVYNYNAGAGVLADPNEPNPDLMIARAQLNGGNAPLTFMKWNGKSFSAAGLGGIDSPIFPTGSFQTCRAAGQGRFGASISYVEDTQQYLLMFVCDSPGDPAAGQVIPTQRGGAWFYSTSYDLSDPGQWSQPQEIIGSWSPFDSNGGCAEYKGWYPTLMSPNKQPGHLTTTGYVFYLWGCQTADTPLPGRRFSSRAFALTVPDFSLAFDQSTVTTSAPSKASVTVNINRTASFAGNVTLTPTLPVPAGIKLPGFPASTAAGSLSFKIKIKGNARPGTYPIVFAGKDDSGRERDATLTLVVH